MPQLQDYPQEARGACHLQGSAPQATPGLSVDFARSAAFTDAN
jgi:hypothetical protein